MVVEILAKMSGVSNAEDPEVLEVMSLLGLVDDV